MASVEICHQDNKQQMLQSVPSYVSHPLEAGDCFQSGVLAPNLAESPNVQSSQNSSIEKCDIEATSAKNEEMLCDNIKQLSMNCQHDQSKTTWYTEQCDEYSTVNPNTSGTNSEIVKSDAPHRTSKISIDCNRQSVQYMNSNDFSPDNPEFSRLLENWKDEHIFGSLLHIPKKCLTDDELSGTDEEDKSKTHLENFSE